MYIIELLFKIKEKIKNKKNHQNITLETESKEQAAEEKCEHIFSAIDSTNTVLACIKCGYLIHCDPKDLEKKNIFENNDLIP